MAFSREIDLGTKAADGAPVSLVIHGEAGERVLAGTSAARAAALLGSRTSPGCAPPTAWRPSARAACA